MLTVGRFTRNFVVGTPIWLTYTLDAYFLSLPQFNVIEGQEGHDDAAQPMQEGQEISAASIASLLGDAGRGATVTYTEGGGTIITTADGTVVQTQQSLEELQKQLQASEGGQNIVLVPPEQLPPGKLLQWVGNIKAEKGS